MSGQGRSDPPAVQTRNNPEAYKAVRRKESVLDTAAIIQSVESQRTSDFSSSTRNQLLVIVVVLVLVCKVVSSR
jgi:hypothetical protein